MKGNRMQAASRTRPHLQEDTGNSIRGSGQWRGGKEIRKARLERVRVNKVAQP